MEKHWADKEKKKKNIHEYLQRTWVEQQKSGAVSKLLLIYNYIWFQWLDLSKMYLIYAWETNSKYLNMVQE